MYAQAVEFVPFLRVSARALFKAVRNETCGEEEEGERGKRAAQLRGAKGLEDAALCYAKEREAS